MDVGRTFTWGWEPRELDDVLARYTQSDAHRKATGGQMHDIRPFWGGPRTQAALVSTDRPGPAGPLASAAVAATTGAAAPGG